MPPLEHSGHCCYYCCPTGEQPAQRAAAHGHGYVHAARPGCLELVWPPYRLDPWSIPGHWLRLAAPGTALPQEGCAWEAAQPHGAAQEAEQVSVEAVWSKRDAQDALPSTWQLLLSQQWQHIVLATAESSAGGSGSMVTVSAALAVVMQVLLRLRLAYNLPPGYCCAGQDHTSTTANRLCVLPIACCRHDNSRCTNLASDQAKKPEKYTQAFRDSFDGHGECYVIAYSRGLLVTLWQSAQPSNHAPCPG